VKTHDAIFRVPARGDAFGAALEGLTRVNVGLMEREHVPPLYEAGVKYKDEPRDIWRHAVDVAHEGWGDCEDLSAYRAAELRVTGEDPAAAVAVYKSGPSRYHAVVQRGDGSIEDPSRALGMGAPKEAKAKPMRNPRPTRTANVVGEDPTPADAITFEIIQIPGGWGRRAGYRGYFRIPLGVLSATGAPQALFSVGPQVPNPQAAVATAATSAAKALVDNPLVQQALSKLPPGAAQAAQVLTNPSVVAALKNPASLLNMQAALARPDIALQNAGKVAAAIKNLF
jgi:hypothetical protein